MLPTNDNIRADVRATGAHGRVAFKGEKENRLFRLSFYIVLKQGMRRFLRIISRYDQPR
jgi:hypothetical protein